MKGDPGYTIVFVACPGHSGSTLLDLILSSHSQVTTVGELKVLSKTRTRSPHGIVYSGYKRGRGWLTSALHEARNRVETTSLLRDHPHLRIRYEALARMPRREVTRIMQWLGLSFEPGQLEWHTKEHHNVGGNGMRFVRPSQIRIDCEWRQALPLHAKVAVSTLQLAARATPWSIGPLRKFLPRAAR